MSMDNGWKSMESAPKDGTIILLKKEDLVHVGWWGGVAGYGWYFLDTTELEPILESGGWTEHFVRPNAWADEPGIGPDGWKELPGVEEVGKQSAALKLASLALSEGVEYVEEPPEKNCSCHLAPPCNDCVDHSAVREFFIDARKALAAIDRLQKGE